MLGDTEFIKNLFDGLGKKKINHQTDDFLIARLKTLRVMHISAKMEANKAVIAGLNEVKGGAKDEKKAFRGSAIKFCFFRDRSQLIKGAINLVESELKARELGERKYTPSVQPDPAKSISQRNAEKKARQKARKLNVPAVEYGNFAVFAEFFGKARPQ